MVLGDATGASCTRISSLNAVRAATSAHAMHRSWRASVLKRSIFTCICTTRPSRTWSTGVGMLQRHCWKQRHTTDMLRPTCAAIHWYVHRASHRPTIRSRSNGWSCSTEIYVLVGRGLLHSRMNVTNTVLVSKHQSYCLQSHNNSGIGRGGAQVGRALSRRQKNK